MAALDSKLNVFDDREKHSNEGSETVRGLDEEDEIGLPRTSKFRLISRRLWGWGIESRGILPVPLTHRKDPQFHKTFFIWLSANCNILSFSAGTLGPLLFELNLTNTSVIILGFNIIGCMIPAYFATFGPKTGLRQMVQSRYSFGYYGAIIPAFLNAVTMMGFMVLNCILAGETLSLVAGGGMSWDVGIAVIAVISLFISFCGYKLLNIYERYAFLPILVVFIVSLIVNRSHLTPSPPSSLPPPTARQVLSFGATIAGFVISYCPLSSDFTNYMREDVNSWKVFVYTYLGFFLPITLIQLLGAAIASNPYFLGPLVDPSLPNILSQILLPTGYHGSKFLLTLLALSPTANIAPTIYSFGLTIQVVLPFHWVLKVPRYALSILAVGIMVPLAIGGETVFYVALGNFLGLIGYWSACFGAIVLTEHLLFRHNSFASYSIPAIFNPALLPVGLAAVTSLVAGMGGAVVCMDQVWFVGPVAKKIGDIGFLVGFGLAMLSYCALRRGERKIFGR